MVTARTSVSDMEAIAAMPGIEEVAKAMVPYADKGQDPVSLTIFNAVQWAVGSRTEAYSLLRHDGLWERLRVSAARVKRTLDGKCPSEEKLAKVRKASADSDGGLGREMATRFVTASRDLVLSCGLLPDQTMRAHLPARANTLYGDGSVFKSYSDAYFDEALEQYVGSRSTGVREARVSESFHGKRDVDGDGKGDKGVPVALVGVHGGIRHQRCVLSVDIYFDRDEMASSLAQLMNVHQVYGDRVHAFAYDRLMTGSTMCQLMGAGIIPIVNVKNATSKNDSGSIKVLSEHRTLIGTKSSPVEHARRDHVDTASHIVNGRPCYHELWTIAGVLVTDSENLWRPTWDSPVVEPVSIHFEPAGQAKRCIGTYRVPCRHGSFIHTLDLTGHRPISPSGRSLLAEVLQPINVTGTALDIRGRRSDVESVFSTLKGTLYKDDRVRSLRLDDCLQDFVGAAMWTNARAWDIHAAQHTTIGKVIHGEITRAEQRRKKRPVR